VITAKETQLDVKVCFAKALTFEEVEDVVLAKKQGVAVRLKEIGKDLSKGAIS